jgi:hypothetical protein
MKYFAGLANSRIRERVLHKAIVKSTRRIDASLHRWPKMSDVAPDTIQMGANVVNLMRDG